MAEVNPGFRSRSCDDFRFWDPGKFLERDHGGFDDEGGQVSARKPVAPLKRHETLRKITAGNRRNSTTRAIQLFSSIILKMTAYLIKIFSCLQRTTLKVQSYM